MADYLFQLRPYTFDKAILIVELNKYFGTTPDVYWINGKFIATHNCHNIVTDKYRSIGYLYRTRINNCPKLIFYDFILLNNKPENRSMIYIYLDNNPNNKRFENILVLYRNQPWNPNLGKMTNFGFILTENIWDEIRDCDDDNGYATRIIAKYAVEYVKHHPKFHRPDDCYSFKM